MLLPLLALTLVLMLWPTEAESSSELRLGIICRKENQRCAVMRLLLLLLLVLG